MALLPEDIVDLRTALSLLTREELELFCLDECVRGDVMSLVLNPFQTSQYFENIGKVPLYEDEMEEMDRIRAFVKSQIKIEEK